MSLLDASRREVHEDGTADADTDLLLLDDEEESNRKSLFRSTDTVPGRVIAATATGLSGLFFAYASLWARINDLNQWGTFGMRLGFLVLLALPLAVVSLSLSTAYRRSQWWELGVIRMLLTTLIGVLALVLSIISAYVMYSALP